MNYIYSAYLQSPEWQKKRTERLKIDNFKCAVCGRPMDLQVHHLNYDNVGHENVYTDLITLCKFCHTDIENEKKAYKARQGYATNWTNQRRLELMFCKAIQHKDLSSGGNLNLTNKDVIRKAWREWTIINGIHFREVRVTTVIDYFRNKRIRLILAMSAAGASPDEIMARGISYNMVHKYYNNPKLANTVMARFEKEMEEVNNAET